MAQITAAGPSLQRDPEAWGAPRVQVDGKNGHWIIRGERNSVEFDTADLGLTVQAGDVEWRFGASSPGDLTARSDGTYHRLRLADAASKDVQPYETGYLKGCKVTLSGYQIGTTADRPPDFS